MVKKKAASQPVAKKKATSASKKPAPRKAPKPEAPKGVVVTRSRNLVTISYGKPHEVLPHLLDLASDFAGRHLAKAAFTSTGAGVLGTPAAREIVSKCANSDCWDCTLGFLKLDSNVFQTCVFNGVQNRGYKIRRDDIPASQSTQLYTVVMAIQGAPKQG
jgi:hypothetical protein